MNEAASYKTISCFTMIRTSEAAVKINPAIISQGNRPDNVSKSLVGRSIISLFNIEKVSSDPCQKSTTPAARNCNPTAISTIATDLPLVQLLHFRVRMILV